MRPRIIICCLLGAAALGAQAPGPDTHRMQITLERQTGEGAWEAIDPGLVLEKGDRVRFRFRANFDGYLYVMNQGTSGRYELLFPREETGEDNRIEAGVEYRIPATQAWFRIDGPPGHDIVYWMVTPLRLGGAPKYRPLPPPPEPLPPPSNLLPRCDDSIFRARGVCVDSSAGPRPVDKKEDLPPNLAGVPRLQSRELVIMRKGEQAVISSPAAAQAPVVYEFRIAHK